ncbi:hypothetical protein HDV02_000669, partial [Globomyces sp. JEL0801]
MESKKKKQNQKLKLNNQHQELLLKESPEIQLDNIEEDEDFNLQITMETLIKLKASDSLNLPKYKLLRTLLHEIFVNKGTTPVGRVSDALRDGRWKDALYELESMRENGIKPKLGALQRWVRDCDAASDPDSQATNPMVLKVLDSILRTTSPDLLSGKSITDDNPLNYLSPWIPNNDKAPKQLLKEFEINETWKSKFRLIYQESGAERRPPNLHDMILYTSEPNTIDTSKHNLTISRTDVPNLPGAFVISNVLTPSECNDMISAAETIGFTPDTPVGGSAKDLVSVLAHNFFWLADDELLNTIYSRCKSFLPQEIQNAGIAGLNARWRCYRYTPGSIYRPHIDGAWPGSGLTADGDYVYDAFGERWSKLTFLIRLNDNFKGGATTFFTPSEKVGVLDALPICPFQGDVLVFPHGDTIGSLLHEGSPVLKTDDDGYGEAKYVIRTE